MSRTIELPDSVYEALREEAAASGITPADWIASRLSGTRTEGGSDSGVHEH